MLELILFYLELVWPFIQGAALYFDPYSEIC